MIYTYKVDFIEGAKSSTTQANAMDYPSPSKQSSTTSGKKVVASQMVHQGLETFQKFRIMRAHDA